MIEELITLIAWHNIFEQKINIARYVNKQTKQLQCFSFSLCLLAAYWLPLFAVPSIAAATDMYAVTTEVATHILNFKRLKAYLIYIFHLIRRYITRAIADPMGSTHS